MLRQTAAATLLACLLAMPGHAQETSQDTTIPCPPSGCSPVPTSLLDADAMKAYLDGEYLSAWSQFESILENAPSDSLARLGLAMCQHRRGEDSLATRSVRRILDDNPRDAAAAQLYSQLLQPNFHPDERPGDADSCWFWIRRSVRLDPNSTEGWIAFWVEATMRGQDSSADDAIRQLARLQAWSPALLALQRLELQACPPGAVLILNGDADLLGTRQLQVVEGLRRDVQVHGALMDAPRYWRAPQRARALPASVDSSWLEGTNQPGSSSLTLGARLSLLQHGTGAWPVVVLTSAKEEAGWEPLFQASRDLLLVRILDGKPPVASDSDWIAATKLLVGSDARVFAGPMTASTDLSPVRRRATGTFANSMYGYAYLLRRLALAAGRKDDALALEAWRSRLAAAVPAKDAQFQQTVRKIAQGESEERAKRNRKKHK